MSQNYGSLREKIAAESQQRRLRYEAYTEAWQKAEAAGLAAGLAVNPAPMVVREEIPDSGRSWFVSEGVCGFAWVSLSDGRSSFGRWAVKTHGARKQYGGGLCLRYVGEFNQSLQRKEAFAAAFAQVLREHLAVPAWPESRLD